MDWGKLCSGVNPKTGKKQTLWAFVGVLGYSRYMMVRLMWTCDSATTLAALSSMFLEMGGYGGRDGVSSLYGTQARHCQRPQAWDDDGGAS